MRAAAVLAAMVLAAAAAPEPAFCAPAAVAIQFQAFAPSQTYVLPGEAVEWANVSERVHTVTASDGSFDSGDVVSGASFSRTFAEPGSFAYHCTLHPVMTGTVEVSSVILDPLPPLPVPAGRPVDVTGRTDEPGGAVRIERGGGGSFHAVATARAGPDGRFRLPLTSTATGDYRAALGTASSQVRRLLVSDRTVRIRPTRAGISVTVQPPAPGAVVVLQLDLRERFGWWPAQRLRLDYLSRAAFRVPRPARARVALVDHDGWTAVATSSVLRLGAPVRAPQRPSEPPREPAAPHSHGARRGASGDAAVAP